jgi:hypothetical protein
MVVLACSGANTHGLASALANAAQKTHIIIQVKRFIVVIFLTRLV